MSVPSMMRIIDELSKALFIAERRRLDDIVSDLDRQNREIKGHVLWGFVHAGQVYVPKNAPNKVTGPRTGLAFALTRQASDFTKDVQTIDNDQKLIEQVLYILLVQCTNMQEVRDMLPESLVSLMPELVAIPRKIQNPGYLLRSDERAFRQFTEMCDKIDFYCATRLLY